jgi:hypothetical protein
MQVLVRSNTDEQEYRMRVAMADLCLQTDIGKSLAQLLKLRNGFCFVCGNVST